MVVAHNHFGAGGYAMLKGSGEHVGAGEHVGGDWHKGGAGVWWKT